ncbi:UNVERIFIED_CONTAM: hypothetical protein Slati_2885100 [Sesamum latifolium]|uniref:Reverse transcriptase zinc-binding domain-containing protein n=1 Tax=Sesamum latifolium TaxID=2727402 RepID=A0AAW2VD22_9LAMI
MIANLWWHNGEARKIHWLNLKKLCTLKAQGGMGSRDLQAFNLAMLSKQVWRLISFPNSLFSKVLRAGYFSDGKILSAKSVQNLSYTWRSMQTAIEIVRGGFRWRIGSGRLVKLAKNVLPTGLNLQKKLRTKGFVCPFCGSDKEDIEHAFSRCSLVFQIWGLSNLHQALISDFPTKPYGWVINVGVYLFLHFLLGDLVEWKSCPYGTNISSGGQPSLIRH